jgi:hypothetical protein
LFYTAIIGRKDVYKVRGNKMQVLSPQRSVQLVVKYVVILLKGSQGFEWLEAEKIQY